MPYTPIPRLTQKDLPRDIPDIVQAVLEVDKLFWLDPKNKRQREFTRKLVPGEELPYQLPAGNDAQGNPFVSVIVQRWGRTFISVGKPVLQIEDVPSEVKPKTKDRQEKEVQPRGSVLEEFRRFMGQFARDREMARKARLATQRTEAERKAQSESDKLRAAERKKANDAKRADLIANKRARKESRRAV